LFPTPHRLRAITGRLPLTRLSLGRRFALDERFLSPPFTRQQL